MRGYFFTWCVFFFPQRVQKPCFFVRHPQSGAASVFAEGADVLQIGANNVANFLLKHIPLS